jgi:hypothetical protein
MRKIVFEDYMPDGTLKKRELKRLTENEVKDYKLLGTAYAENFEFSLYLAHKHCPNFRKRVIAFRVLKGDKTTKSMDSVTERKYQATDFYEKK